MSDSEWIIWDGDEWLYRRLVGEKMNLREELRLGKGTRTVWISGDGRELKVGEMDDNHLANTIEYLRERAREHLSINNGYWKAVTVGEIEGLLFENCITYPALRDEAKRRGFWNEEKIYLGPKQKLQSIKHRQLSLSDKVNLLVELVEELMNK